jgi:hypothetical protein
MQRSARRLGIAIWIAIASSGCRGELYLEPEQAGIDYQLQGEYRAPGVPVAAQVIALGSGEFRAVLLEGGLPGEGFDGQTRRSAEGRLAGERIAFEGAWSGNLEGGRLTGRDPGGKAFVLERVIRRSPSEGAPPPPGALVLFDGAASEHLAEGEADSRGLLSVPARTAEPHSDVLLHVEFRIPFMPRSGGQRKGNSGIYLQERYEVQVLDSFGLPPDRRECGAIYEMHPPRINMTYPPLQWQTYDIDFRAARFDERGAKAEPARVTVRHNGVVIHDDVEICGPTGRGKDESPEPNPLLLQDHWDPVFYRNVWILPRS